MDESSFHDGFASGWYCSLVALTEMMSDGADAAEALLHCARFIKHWAGTVGATIFDVEICVIDDIPEMDA